MKRRTAKKSASTLSDWPSAAKSERRLVKYDELPEYLKDNEFITDYYRCEWPLKDVILSVFSLHNETLNIWTHLVGFLIFLGLMVMSLTETMTLENVISGLFGEGNDGLLKTNMIAQSNASSAIFSCAPQAAIGVAGLSISSLALAPQESYLRHITKSAIWSMTRHSDPLPLWPWLVFLTGAMGCLIFSTVSHLFACHSKRFYLFFWRLDYAGISLMIISSFFAPIYYTFSDHPHWLLLYLSSITLVGVLVVVTLLAPALSAAHFRSFRAALFLCMGFSGVIPATHALVLHWDHPHIRWSLGYEVLMGALYGVGAIFYVTRIPERWRPGAFDVVGHSHQIFHVFVVAAALTHCAATLIIMDWRQGLPV